MKLLRLTSEKTTGEFDCFLNDAIELPPKSQIALQSCVFESTDTKLVIDSNNNSIQFKTSGGVAEPLQEIKLNASPTSVYDSTNTQILFDDIQNKINAKLQMAKSDQIGKQFRIKTGSDGKIAPEFKVVSFSSQVSDLSSNVHKTTVDGVQDSASVAVGTLASKYSMGSLSPTDNKTGLTKYNFFTHYTYPICNGVGVFRVQLSKLETETVLSGGFTMGLSSVAPGDAKDGAFTDNSFITAIQVLDNTATHYSTSINGEAFEVQDADTVAPIYKPNAGDEDLGDYLEISVQSSPTGSDKFIVSTLYSHNIAGSATEVDVTNITAIVWKDNNTNPTDLYAYIFFHGGFLNGTYNCSVRQPKYTPNPFKIPDEHISNTLASDPPELATNLPKQSFGVNTNHTINFVSESLYSWLGYDFGQRPIIKSKNPIFPGDYTFGSKIVADCFIVQLMNLGIDSYDTLPEKQGRENILAIIPKTDEQIRVIYEANGLYFLDINNVSPIKLSNIKLRIVRQDYSQVNTSNISSVVCFIK